MHGHPVFKAMHATAFCCRGCMEKWYKVPQGTQLSEAQVERIVEFLMYWIEKKRIVFVTASRGCSVEN